MPDFDYEKTKSIFQGIVRKASEWTNDHRGLSRCAKPIYDALLSLHNYKQPLNLTSGNQSNIVACLKIILDASVRANNANARILLTQSMFVLNALNILFEKEGLPPSRLL